MCLRRRKSGIVEGMIFSVLEVEVEGAASVDIESVIGFLPFGVSSISLPELSLL